MLAKPRLQRTFIFVSGLCFAGSMVMGLVPLYAGQNQQTGQPVAAVDQPSEQDLLRDEEKGFSLVLQREPENQTALEGLANARMQLGDYAGAIAPLEKLVALHPDRADYRQSLEEAHRKHRQL
ncbi:MAG: tetratricopeptide repeat protein [Cyanobacteriota bacterium]